MWNRAKNMLLFIVATAVTIVTVFYIASIWNSDRAAINDVNESSEESVVEHEKKFDGIVTDKYDYISYNYQNTSEVYMIEYEVTYADGIKEKQQQRVTSVAYQNIKIGDKFDAQKYMAR